MEREQQPAKVIRRIQPAQFDVEQLVTMAGMAFTFRARPCDGGILIAFNDDLASVKARIGRVQRPGKPPLRRKD